MARRSRAMKTPGSRESGVGVSVVTEGEGFGRGGPEIDRFEPLVGEVHPATVCDDGRCARARHEPDLGPGDVATPCVAHGAEGAPDADVKRHIVILRLVAGGCRDCHPAPPAAAALLRGSAMRT